MMSDQPVRIFIVEDERRIARFLQIELEHEGFETEIEDKVPGLDIGADDHTTNPVASPV